MKAFGSFSKNLVKDFPYEEGKEFHAERERGDGAGFYACEYPLDCLSYCNPAHCVFHEVELSGKIYKSNYNTHVSATNIKIGPRLSITELVKKTIDLIVSNVNREIASDQSRDFSSSAEDYSATSVSGEYSTASTTGEGSASSATGYYSTASATGSFSAASATGYYCASSVTGPKSASSVAGNYSVSSATEDFSAASTAGDFGAASTTGFYSASSAIGDGSISSAAGHYSASFATGNFSTASATGDFSAVSAIGHCCTSSVTGHKAAASVSDPTGVAVAWGHEAMAKGCKGSHLVLSDWKYVGEKGLNGMHKDPYETESWELIGAKLIVVDGEKIKEDTYYRCIEGEIIEVTEDIDIAQNSCNNRKW